MYGESVVEGKRHDEAERMAERVCCGWCEGVRGKVWLVVIVAERYRGGEYVSLKYIAQLFHIHCSIVS